MQGRESLLVGVVCAKLRQQTTTRFCQVESTVYHFQPSKFEPRCAFKARVELAPPPPPNLVVRAVDGRPRDVGVQVDPSETRSLKGDVLSTG